MFLSSDKLDSYYLFEFNRKDLRFRDDAPQINVFMASRQQFEKESTSYLRAFTKSIRDLERVKRDKKFDTTT